MRFRRGWAGAGVLCMMIGACSDDDTAEPSATTGAVSSTDVASPSSSAVARPDCGRPDPGLVRPDLDRIVTVFLICGDGVIPVDLRAVDRVVPEDDAPLRATLNQLLIGVTPDEAAEGLGSAFSTFTAGQLLGVALEDGIARLDFTSGFEFTNNFSTSNLSGVVMSQIGQTVFQFNEVTGLDFSIEGERWCGWENTCDEQPVPLVERP